MPDTTRDDDPRTDPVGTVRRGPNNTWVKVTDPPDDTDCWVMLGTAYDEPLWMAPNRKVRGVPRVPVSPVEADTPTTRNEAFPRSTARTYYELQMAGIRAALGLDEWATVPQIIAKIRAASAPAVTPEQLRYLLIDAYTLGRDDEEAEAGFKTEDELHQTLAAEDEKSAQYLRAAGIAVSASGEVPQ